jgi:hypothetical protein
MKNVSIKSSEGKKLHVWVEEDCIHRNFYNKIIINLNVKTILWLLKVKEVS